MNNNLSLTAKNKYNIGKLSSDPRPDMPLVEAIMTRRTVRRYSAEPVPHVVLERLLRLSTHAPSACNRRGWRFIVIEDADSLEWLYKKGGAAFIPKAKQAILVCYFRYTDNDEWRDGEQSAAAAISYFQLLAHTEGIGSCWICHLPSRSEVGSYFEVPKNYVPIALLTVGFYDNKMDVVQRKVDDEDILSAEKWTFAEAPNKDTVGWKLIVKKIARKLYYLFPKRELLRKLTNRYEKKFDNHD